MIKMTKEEVIEVFIEYLGKNGIIESFMTKEQIIRKLNRLICEVTYEPEKSSAMAAWRTYRSGRGNLNFDINKILYGQENMVIVHEVLHALSSKGKIEQGGSGIVKIGFKFSYFDNSNPTQDYNTGINEGMTEYLTEKLTGRCSSIAYETETDVCRIIESVLGEEAMLKKYFSSQMVKRPYDIFKNELKKLYGTELGNEINDIVRKILALTDKYTTININKEQYNDNNKNNMRRQIIDELKDAINLFVKTVLSNEKDLKRRTDIIIKYIKSSLGGLVFYDMTRDSQSEFYVMLKECTNSTLLSREEKLMILKDLVLLCRCDYGSMAGIISDLYFECKNTEDNNAKRGIFYDILYTFYPETLEEIDSLLEEIYYEKIGDIYRICESEVRGIEIGGPRKGFYGKNNDFWKWEYNKVNSETLDCERIKMFTEQTGSTDEIIAKILEQVKNIVKVEGYDTFDFLILMEKNYIYDSNTGIRQISIGTISDCMIRLRVVECQVDNYYKISEDGTIKLIEVGEKRRLLDDTSELDLRLKDGTEDVSIIEIEEELNDMQLALESEGKDYVSEENSRGEKYDE